MYPLNFDPVWRSSECKNFTPAKPDSAVSHAVSHVEQ